MTRSGDSAHSFLSRPELALDRVAGGELWALRRREVDPLRGVLHVRQTVKRDVASRHADRATVGACGRAVGAPKNGKARTIGLPRWLRDMLAEHPTRPAPGAGPEHTVFHTASGKAVYDTVFTRGVFAPAEAAPPAEKQGLRFHDLRDTRATLLIAAGRTRLGHSSITTTLNLHGHVLRCTEAALVDALYEQCDEGVYAAAAQLG